jgi:hypothetical protein
VTFAKGKGRGSKYGWAHQQERARRAARHQPSDLCVRCHQPLGPMSKRLHLDHAEDGTYLGFAHEGCNRSAGASKGARTTNARRQPSAPFKRPTR